MTQPATAPTAQPVSTSSARMILTMGAIGLISGMLIVLTYQLTLPIIANNKAEALQRAVFEVMPGAERTRSFQLSGEQLAPLAEGEKAERIFYAGYDEAGQLVGVAVEASGQGFQDTLHILYGYSPERQCIIGMKVLESKETPGLGDKIEKDPAFRANFEQLEVRLDASGKRMEHPVELAKHGEKESPWQIEAITGATISSRAIATILHDSTAEVVPVLMENLPVLAESQPELVEGAE